MLRAAPHNKEAGRGTDVKRKDLITFLAAGLTAGFAAGGIRGLSEIISQRYLHDRMFHLAALTLQKQIVLWASAGLFAALALRVCAGCALCLLNTTAPGRRLKSVWRSLHTGYVLAALVIFFGICNVYLVVDPVLIARGAAGLAAAVLAFFGLRKYPVFSPAWHWLKTTVSVRHIRLNALACAALAAALSLYAAVKPPAAAPSGPDIILIYLDALRADHLGCYGYGRNTSPHIDSLARSGARFETVISQAPCTYPSVFSSLTSRYASHFFEARTLLLEKKYVTLAEVLKNGGYHTAAVSSSPIVTKANGQAGAGGFEQGFDLFDAGPAKGDVWSWQSRSPEGVIDKALGFLEKKRQGRYFLFLYIMDPHAPYAPPGRYGKRYPPACPDCGTQNAGNPTVHSRRINRGWKEDITPGRVRQLRALYDGEIAYADEQIGRLLEHLRAENALDETLVVVTSDHGEEFFEHGGFEHCNTLYNELIRVPLVVRYPPAVDRGAVVRGVRVESLDMAPTILDFAGLAAPASMEGRSLRGLMAGKDPSFRDFAFSEAPFVDAKAILQGPWKYIHHFEAGPVKEGLCDKYTKGRKLFNLAEDPGETVNRYAEYPRVAEKLYALMLDMLPPRERMRVKASRSIELSDGAKERLKGLGYLQ